MAVDFGRGGGGAAVLNDIELVVVVLLRTATQQQSLAGGVRCAGHPDAAHSDPPQRHTDSCLSVAMTA